MSNNTPVVNSILIVDDSPINRVLLQTLLNPIVDQFFFAENGLEAIESYVRDCPDIVLMDINMPEMDGIEATKKIKEIAGRSFCPIIFITGSTEEDIILECIDAGGDDFIAKPFSKAMVEAKVKAMARFAKLYKDSEQLNNIVEREAELAEGIFSDALMSKNVGLDFIDLMQKPASRFSGDVLLTAYRPNGDINILLGDFTGHGLSAAIGALPVADIFRAMTAKGFSCQDIMAQINRKLYSFLPTGMFLALGLVSLSVRERTADIYNCGLPDIWIFDKESNDLKASVQSCHPALGIIDELMSDNIVKRITVHADDYIVMATDGVMEAVNDNGDMFGEQPFLQTCLSGFKGNSLTKSILSSLSDFCTDTIQNDDISFFVIPCHKDLIPKELLYSSETKKVEETTIHGDQSWNWSVILSGNQLLKLNPVPLALNQLREFEGENDQWQSVFTILTELYVNAVDHGVLQLSSELKSTPEGFCEYFVERERRLGVLEYGEVKISMTYSRTRSGGNLMITVNDSGCGFDFQALNDKYNSDDVHKIISNDMSGRGIELVSKMCERLEYSLNGTQSQATYIVKK